MNTSLLGMLLYWSDFSMSDFCELPFASLKNRWTQVWSKSFFFDAKLLYLISLKSQLRTRKQYVNIRMVNILLHWCDVVRSQNSTIFPFHLSTIAEQESHWNPSLLVWCYFMSQLFDLSFASLSSRRTQICWQAFSADVILWNSTILRSFDFVSQREMNTFLVEILLHWCDTLWSYVQNVFLYISS